jgi:hypothetical protein
LIRLPTESRSGIHSEWSWYDVITGRDLGWRGPGFVTFLFGNT